MEDLAASADVVRLSQTNFADFFRHRGEPVFRALALT
jgi:hypothetical protein